MPYNGNNTPDAPMPLSMMPRVVTPTLDDLLYLVQPNNPLGQKSKSVTLRQLQSSDFFAKVNVVPIEFSASQDVEITSDKPYTIILLNNKQNVANTALTLLAPGTQDVRSIVDVVVNWRDQDTEPIKVNVGNGYYLLHPQNNEWGRFFIGSEGRCWSHQISVEDHTIGNLFSGSGTISDTARMWELGNKGFTFTATINGAVHEVKLSVKNGGWVLEGADNFQAEKIQCGGLCIQNIDQYKSHVPVNSDYDFLDGYDLPADIPYSSGTLIVVSNWSSSQTYAIKWVDATNGTSAPSNYSSGSLSPGKSFLFVVEGAFRGTDNKWRVGLNKIS